LKLFLGGRNAQARSGFMCTYVLLQWPWMLEKESEPLLKFTHLSTHTPTQKGGFLGGTKHIRINHVPVHVAAAVPPPGQTQK